MNPKANIAVSAVFMLLAIFVLIIVFVRQDFSTYGIVLMVAAIMLIALFCANIWWTLRNRKDLEKLNKKEPDEKSVKQEAVEDQESENDGSE